MNGWVHGWTDGWVDAWVDGWMGGWIGGRVGGWVDGWTDGCRGVLRGLVTQTKPPCRFLSISLLSPTLEFLEGSPVNSELLQPAGVRLGSDWGQTGVPKHSAQHCCWTAQGCSAWTRFPWTLPRGKRPQKEGPLARMTST